MSSHTLPIVPHVLYVAVQTHPWQLAPIERLATRYHTPTTVSLAFGTIGDVKPQKGKSGTTKQQYHVWCLPDDAAWERVQACRAAFQQALDLFADYLRLLGSYATRLEKGGGIKKAPNPLCPTVIAVDDPDSTDTHYFISNPVPRIQRAEISGHTPKMLNVVRDGRPWSTSHQRNHFVCPADDHWQMIERRQQKAQAAYEDWQRLLRELGTYQEALGDGRYAAAQAAAAVAAANAQVDRVLALASDRAPAEPVAVGVAMMDATEARALVERIRGGIEQMRADLLDLYEREGWRALGYESWRACAVAEFGASAATLYRQLEAAEIERDVRGPGVSQVEKTQPIPTVQLQAVRDLEPAQRREAFTRADQVAGDRPRTAADVRQAAQEIQPAGPSIADGQHIKQIKQILRTLDQWSAREHSRLFQEAYSHAHQIKDTESYEALMAEIDRAAEGQTKGDAFALPKTELRRQRPALPPDVPPFHSIYDEMHWRIDRRDWVGAQALIDSLPLGAVGARKQLAAQLALAQPQPQKSAEPAPAAPAPAWWNVGAQLRAIDKALSSANRNDAIAAAQQLLQALHYPVERTRPRKPASADSSAQLRYLTDLENYALMLESLLGLHRQSAPAAIETEEEVPV